jgi:hypothetical protein
VLVMIEEKSLVYPLIINPILSQARSLSTSNC